MPPKDIEGEEIASGDRVVIQFEVTGVYRDAIAAKPIDPHGEKHATVTYEGRLCRKLPGERSDGAPN